MTAWTMFSWRRLYSGRGAESSEDTRVELPADTRQLVYNVYVYFSRRPGRSAKTSLAKTARATMLPREIVADIIRDRYQN
ncbi:jg23902 [Pararge aegeria aegeria]|uniref:Jg23902 protein n=1 Tax=Pararge aegeria aegeria TaxID=348720 RepID=A0A8S4S7W6_9NEOP|nr:jg23902 [Pararge aegeria aegeria]